jgi:pyruvate/2-oxoglutarate dehydrogenase complex dihydrolipoamide acyltransferase (E2) component
VLDVRAGDTVAVDATLAERDAIAERDAVGDSDPVSDDDPVLGVSAGELGAVLPEPAVHAAHAAATSTPAAVTANDRAAITRYVRIAPTGKHHARAALAAAPANANLWKTLDVAG